MVLFIFYFSSQIDPSIRCLQSKCTSLHQPASIKWKFIKKNRKKTKWRIKQFPCVCVCVCVYFFFCWTRLKHLIFFLRFSVFASNGERVWVYVCALVVCIVVGAFLFLRLTKCLPSALNTHFSRATFSFAATPPLFLLRYSPTQ